MAKNKVQTVQRPRLPAPQLLQGLMREAQKKRDGHALPLQRLPSTSTESNRFGVDISSAPVPQRRYAAELASVSFVRNEARFVFAQSGVTGVSIDSALVIRMSPVALAQFALSIHEIIVGSLAETCERWKVTPEPSSKIDSEPQQMANMVANICAVAIAGDETCMDFYHASAFASKKSESSDELEVEPVVRVDLRSSLFVGLIESIFAIEANLLATHREGAL